VILSAAGQNTGVGRVARGHPAGLTAASGALVSAVAPDNPGCVGGGSPVLVSVVLVAVVGVSVLALVGVVWRRQGRLVVADRQYESGRCMACGYDVRACGTRCPECGGDLVAQVVRESGPRLPGPEGEAGDDPAPRTGGDKGTRSSRASRG
jgi:hypothetical protein